MLAQKEHKRRHDNVARIIHWEICGKYDLEKAERSYEHEPGGIAENERIKVLWDFMIQCDHMLIQCRKPDVFVVKKKSCLITYNFYCYTIIGALGVVSKKIEKIR